MEHWAYGCEVWPCEGDARDDRTKGVTAKRDAGGRLKKALGFHVTYELAREILAELLEGCMRGVRLVRRGAEEAKAVWVWVH